jgi:hypothetical protein
MALMMTVTVGVATVSVQARYVSTRTGRVLSRRTGSLCPLRSIVVRSRRIHLRRSNGHVSFLIIVIVRDHPRMSIESRKMIEKLQFKVNNCLLLRSHLLLLFLALLFLFSLLFSCLLRVLVLPELIDVDLSQRRCF